MVQNGQKKRPSKWGQNDTKTTPKRCQNDAKMVLSDPKVTPIDPKKWGQNHLKITRNGPILVPKNAPKMALYSPRYGQKWLRNGQKGGQEWPKKRRFKSHLDLDKSEKKTQNPLSIFQAYPLAAHFHRWKRRF